MYSLIIKSSFIFQPVIHLIMTTFAWYHLYGWDILKICREIFLDHETSLRFQSIVFEWNVPELSGFFINCLLSLISVLTLKFSCYLLLSLASLKFFHIFLPSLLRVDLLYYQSFPIFIELKCFCLCLFSDEKLLHYCLQIFECSKI
mgnify:FL=1